MPDLGDLILFAISSRGRLPWHAFRSAFDDLYPLIARTESGAVHEPDRHQRRRAALVLDALAHCEVLFDPQGGHVSVSTALLAALPCAGLPRAVLCGSRSPGTVQDLRAVAAASNGGVRVRAMSQAATMPSAPARIEVEADSDSGLRQFAQALGIPYEEIPPAWSIIGLSGTVSGYLETLAWSERPELDWPRSDFNPALLQFGPPKARDQRLALSRYLDPIRGQPAYWLWRGTLSATVDPSWGRYVVLSREGRHAYRYEPVTGQLAVPRTVPLPRLLARAATLCSGYAPGAMAARNGEARGGPLGFDVYRAVPPDVYRVLSEKVEQLDITGTPG